MAPKVAVLRTSPSTVVQDYSRLAELSGFASELKKDAPSIVKINLSWTKFFPACSTPPWQLDAVLDLMKKSGIKDIHPVENQTVVTHPWKGAYYNKWLPVLQKHGIPFEPLTDVKWKEYSPKSEMLAMTKTFDKILVPEMFFGANVIHLPTMKTHGHTTTTGSMKNAFGGLIPKYRHHAHKRIHEILVDLLAIQREIHPSIFTFMDGAVAGNGAGPRTMVPVNANLVLASADPVAIDAISARLMGFDPMKIDYLRISHERGLGSADTDAIEILGMEQNEFEKTNLGFEAKKSIVIKWDQRIRKGTMSSPALHNFLFKSAFFKLFIAASGTYHDYLWYPTIGKSRIRKFMKSEWGGLFKSYEYGEFPKYKKVEEWDPY